MGQVDRIIENLGSFDYHEAEEQQQQQQQQQQPIANEVSSNI